HFPRRPTLAHRHAGAATAWIRNDRASRPGTGGTGFSRSTLGFDLLISWRKIFSEVAETFSLPRHSRLRRASFRGGGNNPTRSRRFTKAWSRLLRATARIAAAYCATCRARTQTLAFRHPRNRWNGGQKVDVRKTPGCFDHAQSLPSENVSGETNRNCVTGQQGRSRCQSRGDIG